MNCYRIAASAEEATHFAKDVSLAPYTPTAAEELTAVLVSACWTLEETYHWNCFAENDGGIDASDETVTNIALLFQNFVFDQGTPIGYLFHSHVLYFADPKPIKLIENEDKEYVPCWGTVSDSYTYLLRPIPEKAHLLDYDTASLRYENGFLIESGVLLTSCGELPSKLVLPEGITRIESAVFKKNETLTSVVLPEGLEAIGEEAFYDCPALNSVILPSTLKTVGRAAFYRCSALESITLPDTLETVGDYALGRCTSLKTIALPATLKKLPYALLTGNTALTAVTFAEGLETVGREVFSECSALTEIVLPDSVSYLGARAFEDCTALETVTLSKNLTVIDTSVFENCTALKRIVLPEGITKIPFDTFRGCTALCDVTIPESVKAIEGGAFRGCTALSRITLPTTLETLGILPFNSTAIQEITVHQALAKTLQAYSLLSMDGLKTVVFAEGVDTIHHPDACRLCYGNIDTVLPEGVFASLKTVEALALPASLTEFDPTLMTSSTSLKRVSIAKGFEKLTPEILPEGITLTLEGMPADWSALDDAFKTALKEKNITLVFSDETV